MNKKIKFVITISSILIFFGVIGIVYFINNRDNSSRDSLAASTTYYISPTGSNTNPGTQISPWRNFSYAFTQLQAGDTLLLLGGTYNERMLISASGTQLAPIKISVVNGQTAIVDLNRGSGIPLDIRGNYIEVSNITFIDSATMCVSLSGSNIIVSNVVVTDCVTHGIQTSGNKITVQNSTITNTVLENDPSSPDGGWGSAMKVYVGSNDITLKNNTVYRNYGEGFGITRGLNVIVENNRIYDNFQVNLYIDNSSNVMAQNNLIGCSANDPSYIRSGSKASGMMSGIEEYSGWGDQYNNVTLKNNIVFGCNYGYLYYSSEVANTSLKNTFIYNNTFWGIERTAISINSKPLTNNVRVANNIVHYAQGGKHSYLGDNVNLIFHNNFWVGTPNGVTGLANGSGDLSGDVRLATSPTFNNIESFKLSSQSPAINKGANNLVDKDIFGTTRPVGGVSDMGVHEFSTTTPTPSEVTTLNLTPTQDTYVRQKSATSNYNNSTVLKINGSPILNSYIKFDLSSLQGKNIRSATLQLYSVDGISNTNKVYLYQTVYTSWDSSTMTYRTQPKIGSLVASSNGVAINTWTRFNVTNLVNLKKGGNVGFAIKKSGNDLLQFTSLEGINKPKLVVEYE